MDIDKKYLVGIDEAAELLGVSRATFNRWHDDGKLGPMPIRIVTNQSRQNKCRPLWCNQELKEWVYAHCPDRAQWQISRQKKNKEFN